MKITTDIIKMFRKIIEIVNVTFFQKDISCFSKTHILNITRL